MVDLRDPSEIGELLAEAWALENTRVVDGRTEFRCPICGDWCALDDAEYTSPAPEGLPICPSCGTLTSAARDGDDDASEQVIEMTARQMRERR